jgi:hypothetical protein
MMMMIGSRVFQNELTIVIKAKETKKCHHRQLMSADAVEFGQL